MKNIIIKSIIILMFFQISTSLFAAHLVVPVKIAQCQEQEIYDTYHAIGKASNSKRKDFLANISGVIDFITPNQGAKVSAGQTVLIIEKDLAQTTKTRAEKAYQEAQLNLTRSLSLYKDKVISSQELEKAQIDANNAKLDREKAKNLYEDMVMIAPFDGIMGSVTYSEGEYVSAKQASPEVLFSIIDVKSPMIANFYLPENLLNKIHNGAKVNISYQNHTISASVMFASAYISAANGGFLTKVLIEQNSQIPDGAFVEAQFMLDARNALMVPEESVQQNMNNNTSESIIYLVENQQAKALPIQIGVRQKGMIEVISKELNKSCVIVKEGIYKLYNGAKVQIIQ